MKTIQGNFLIQPSQSFPHDCELYDSMQKMPFLAHIIGNVAGDKAILLGCEKNGNRRNEGYVFIRTKAHPEGEVLWFEGGAESAGMYVKYKTEMVSAQGINYDKAYTHYWLAEGMGEESFRWRDFTEINTLPQLQKEIDAKEAEIAALTPPPLGVVQIWAGRNLPDNYALCDGAQLRQEDYPELFSVIGTAFNATADHANNPQTTSPGYFRLPDLRGRFIVGESSVDGDYKVKGSTGGEKKHQLTIDEMPSHNHKYWTWETGGSDRNRFSGRSNNDDPNKREFDTSSAGGNKSHENRPPYYTLAYIMRTK